MFSGRSAPTTTRRVFIADDHDGYRAGVARLVGEHPALEVVGQAADGDAAFAGIVEHQPDVALLDVRMPGLSGIEVCRRLQAEGSVPTRVVLITGTPDPVLSEQAAAAGAVALLGKETPPATIAAQLLAAADGRVGWSVE